MTLLKTSITCLLMTTALTTSSLGANKTPGDDIGSDHTGYAFNAYAFANVQGEAAFAKHVGTGAAAGQQYAISSYSQSSSSTSVPSACTVANLYSIINDNEDNLAALLILTHGGTNALSIEPFAKTPAGLVARDARFNAYINGTVAGCPAFTTAEIYQSNNHDAYAIGITSTFIANHGRMNESLVFVAACKGSTMTDDFVAADARVSVGFVDTVYKDDCASSVKTFFRRMDGQEGIDKRPVATAMNNLDHPLGSSGNTATTLAPAVKTFDAPCPIKVGDKVTYTLDTECEQDNIGDIVGNAVTIENEIWISKTQIQGTCTAVANDGTIYSLRLKYNNVYSDQNIARLDGNIRPFLINARGPAHDDYLKWKFCPVFCLADLTGDNAVNIADLLKLLDSWGSQDASLDIDGSGSVDIADVLLLLGSWGSTCETGACCIDNQCVEDLSEQQCLDLDGIYNGDDSLCESDDMCAETGACCFPPYECYDHVFEDDCLYWGGIFSGDNTSCSTSECWIDPRGACCYEETTCIDNMPLSTCEFSGGYFIGIDTNCFDDPCPFSDPGGACCIQSAEETQCLDFATEDECAFLGGDYRGPNTLCEQELCLPVGACCVTVGETPSCIDFVTEDLCEDGSWYEGQTCVDIEFECTPPWGACCLPDLDACLDGFSEIECIDSQGVFHLEQICSEVTCETSVGACCLMNSCVLSTPSDCIGMGGSFYGSGTDCDLLPCEVPVLLGACCVLFPGGLECHEVTADECFDLAGLYAGDGTICEPGICEDMQNYGACCFPEGGCQDNVEEELCHYQLGIFYPDSSCSDLNCS